MSHLFSPLTIRDVTFKNRIAVSPMCMYAAEDGFANDWHLVHLGSRAVGGAGLVMQEATAVSPEGRITHADLGLWKDEQMVPLKRMVDFIHAQGSVAGIQLAHAGRKASATEPWNGSRSLTAEEKSWTILGPSAIAFSDQYVAPAAMTEDDIRRVISDFRSAALRARSVGYQVIELHAAHGYLINEFLSPFSNQRTDAYGGSFENRIRFLLEIVDAVRSVWPETLPLFVRFSATEWQEGGWSIEDSVRLALVLKDKRVDLIDCSSGGNITGVRIPLVPGYQVPLAEAVRRGSGLLTGAVGLITEAQQAEAILAEGKADLIFMARALLRDPYFPLRAAADLGEEWQWPVRYERARPKQK